MQIGAGFSKFKLKIVYYIKKLHEINEDIINLDLINNICKKKTEHKKR